METPAGQPSKRHDAWAAGMSLFALMTGHSLLETARDALFLTSLPASQLPWAYLAIAAVALLVARANRTISERWDKRTLLAATLAALGLGTVGFWGLFASDSHFVPHAFYVWTGVVASVAVVQFWLLLGEVFTVTEAKRLYAAIAAGGVVGAMAGSGLSDLMLRWTDARHLLLVGAGFLAVAGVMPRMCGRADEAARGHGRSSPSMDAADVDHRPRAYLRKLMAVTLLSTIALTIVDFLFKSEVARVVPAADLGMFFARFYLALNAVALAVQVLLTPSLLRSFGANRALLALPILLGFGAAGLAVAAGLLPVLLLKAADGTLRHTLHRSAMEVLYLPLSHAARSHCKGIIDAVGQRGGQAIASLAILGAVFVGAQPVLLAVLVGVVAIAWVGAVIGIKGLYLELFRGHLRDGAIETRIDVPELDLYSLETLVSSLNSESDEEVLATLDLLDGYGKHNVIPALLLYHPSSAVVLRTLELLVTHGRSDFVSVANRLLDHGDLEVRAAAMRALATVLPEEELRRAAHEQHAPVVRAAALVGLIARGADDDGSLDRELNDYADADLEQRLAVTRAIRYQRDTRFAPLLVRLAVGADPSLQRELATAMGALGSAELTRPLIAMIANRKARSKAREAIASIGVGALPALGEALRSASSRRTTRIHLPNTIARIHHPHSMEVLLDALAHEQDGLVRFKMIRALERLRHLVNDAKIDRVALRRMISDSLHRAIQMLDGSVATRHAQGLDSSLATAGGELLLAVLLEKQNNAIDRAIRLASLLRPNEDFRLIHLGLRSRNRRLRAESVELLEAALDPSISAGLIALVDDAPDEERLARATDAIGYRPEQMDYVGRLRAMLLDGSEAVRCVAAYHVGELELSELHAPLQAARPEASAFLSDIIDRTLATLSLPPVPGARHAT